MNKQEKSKKIEWKFKKDPKPQGEGDFWYDLTNGGYIKPEDVLADATQLAELQKAIAILESFQDALAEAELLEDF